MEQRNGGRDGKRRHRRFRRRLSDVQQRGAKPTMSTAGASLCFRRGVADGCPFVRCLFTSLSRAFFQRPSAHPLSSGRFLVESWPVGPPNSSTLRELQQDRGSETAGVWGGVVHLGKGAACTNTCARLITSNFRNFVAVSHKVKLPLAAESEFWVQTAQGAFLCGLMSPPVLPGFLTQPTDVHLMGR